VIPEGGGGKEQILASARGDDGVVGARDGGTMV